MSPIIVDSEPFATALKATKVTAFSGKDPYLATTYLHSDRRDLGEGPTDVLVFTSYNGSSVGQYAIEVDGQLDHPALLDITDITSINGGTKQAQKKMREEAGKQAKLQIRLELIKTEAGSEALRITTITDGKMGDFDAKYEPALSPLIEDYPLEDAMIYLAGSPVDTVRDRDGKDLPQGNALVVSSEQSKVMDGIQKVFKEDHVFCYPQGHTANRRTLTCSNWRASVPGAEYAADTDVNNPTIDVNNPTIDVYYPPNAEDIASDVPARVSGAAALKASTEHVETLA